MYKKFLIAIDMKALRANMSKEEGRPLSDQEVCQWLIDAGFIATGDHWVVEERDLGQLDPSEVISIADVPAETT